MKKGIPVGFAAAIGVLIAALTFSITALVYQNIYAAEGFRGYLFEEKYPKLVEAVEYIEENSAAELDLEAAQNAMLSGFVYGVGDKYANYLDADNASAFISGVEGKAIGLGIMVAEREQRPQIVDVYDNSPAAGAGLAAGDYIMDIDGEDTIEIGYYNSLDKLVGKDNAITRLRILRGEEELEFSLVRAEYSVVAVKYSELDGKVGYVKVREFTVAAAQEFKSALETLAGNGCVSFVIDLRNCVGGELGSIVETLDFLLPEGRILTLRYKNGSIEQYDSDAACFEGEFAVLVNGQTYSAAELFAAAFKDFGAGMVFGSRTYGKGMMQTTRTFSDGTAILVSTAFFDPPSSPNFDGVGVEPDVEAPDDEEENNSLAAALEYLQKLNAE